MNRISRLVSTLVTVLLLLLLGYRAQPGPAVQKWELHARTGSCSWHKDELRRIFEDGDSISAPWPSFAWHWLYSCEAGSHRQQKQNSAQGRLLCNLIMSDIFLVFKKFKFVVPFHIWREIVNLKVCSVLTRLPAGQMKCIISLALRLLWLQRNTSGCLLAV